MRIMTDGEYRDRILEAKEEVARRYERDEEYRHLLDRIMRLEEKVYRLEEKERR